MTANNHVHAALRHFCDDDTDLIVAWTVTAEIVRSDGNKYLMHRHGGGIDGDDRGTVWHVAGMIRAAQLDVEDQLQRMSVELDDDEEEDDD